MKATKIICYGTLKKVENIAPINIPEGMNALVYESRSPFKGYYDNLPGKHNNPTYLYLPINNFHDFIDLHRVILTTRCNIAGCVDMDHARLRIHNNDVYAIRLRGFEDLSQVVKIQKALAEQGVKFISKSSIKNYECSTRISKYFSLVTEDDGIWLDDKVSQHGYIKLTKHVNFEDFYTLVGKVRNNWTGYSFDAAQATLCSEDKVIDMVRVYSKHVKDEDYLKDLKKVFDAIFK